MVFDNVGLGGGGERGTVILRDKVCQGFDKSSR